MRFEFFIGNQSSRPDTGAVNDYRKLRLHLFEVVKSFACLNQSAGGSVTVLQIRQINCGVDQRNAETKAIGKAVSEFRRIDYSSTEPAGPIGNRNGSVATESQQLEHRHATARFLAELMKCLKGFKRPLDRAIEWFYVVGKPNGSGGSGRCL